MTDAAAETARGIIDELERRIKEYRAANRPDPESRSIETWLVSAVEAALRAKDEEIARLQAKEKWRAEQRAELERLREALDKIFKYEDINSKSFTWAKEALGL